MAVLGPMVVLVDGGAVDLGGPKQRALLAALVLHRPRPVSPDTLIDLVWGDDAPAAAVSSVHGYIARLRRVLEPERSARAPAAVLIRSDQGYALRLADEDIDASRFIAITHRVHGRLANAAGLVPAAPPAMTAAELVELAGRLDEALAQWRGEPYAELGDAAAAVAERVRLGELYLAAREDRALIRTELGEHTTAVAELGALAQEHPMREGLWALWALALARAGRQADALAALRQIRGVLADELGVDPGEQLRAVEAAVLAQDACVLRPAPRALDAAAANRPAGPAGTVERAGALEPTVDDPQRWPVVDRDTELERLMSLLDQARAGRTRFAMLVGEPGIGKSRLVEEVTRRAEGAGFVVSVGRCSADEGAPPFWPWRQAVHDLRTRADAEAVADVPALFRAGEPSPDASDGPPSDGSHSVESERFRVAEAVRRLLVAVAARQPVLLVLEDLHWSDLSSLRLLHHLVQQLTDAGVLVLVTRRAHPEPTGVLADVGEALSRRHAVRLDLGGLSDDGVSRLVSAVTGREATREVVTSLRARTDGNPFFLVELVRLLAGPGGSAADARDVPAAVNDVVAARVARLPDATRALLQTAAVLGREWQLSDLSTVVDRDVETVLDGLDPALAAGIVMEEPRVGWFRFAHALVRDSVYRTQAATRRARRHAAVAAALELRGPDRLSEAARHWFAAGPVHAATAWRRAAQTARQAQRLRGYEEAAQLLASAVQAQAQDAGCGPLQRYDLLMDYADACRSIGDRDGQLDALDRAVREAESLGDIERLARAAVGTADGSLWTIRAPGVVHQPAIAALRRVLRELPAGDSDLRCQALLSLSGELHYADAPQERDALAEEGLAMARRISDPALGAWAAATAFVATWGSSNAEARWQMVDQAVHAEAANLVFRAHLLTLRAIASMETARIGAMWRDHAEARKLAQRLRLPFVLLVLDNFELPWRAMQGRDAEVERLVDEMRGLPLPVQPRELLDLSIKLYSSMWKGRAAELLPALRAGYAALPLAYVPLYLLALARAQERDEAQAVMAGGVAPLLEGYPWSLTYDLAVVAEAAYLSGDVRNASVAYERLAQYAGRPAAAGSSGVLGPVDAYLALAAAAAGEPDIARRHADDAAALAAEWKLPVFARWLAELRDRGGW